MDIDAEAGAIAQVLLDDVSEVLQGNDDLGDAVAFEQLDDVDDGRPVNHRDHRLGSSDGEGAQAGAFTACHDNSLHREASLRSSYEL